MLLHEGNIISIPALSGADVDFARIHSVPAPPYFTANKGWGSGPACSVLLVLVLGSRQLPALGVSPPATQQGQQFKIHPAVKLKQANYIFAPQHQSMG